MNPTHLAADQNSLRFALGLPSDPAYLDIKPVELLTAGERRRFSERLAAITHDLRVRSLQGFVRNWRP